MICPFCNKEFTSEKVYRIHTAECKTLHKPSELVVSEERAVVEPSIHELRQKAKEKGIKGYMRIKKEKLVELIGDEAGW